MAKAQPDTPDCTDPHGHLWMGGQSEVGDAGLEYLTRKCIHCGAEEELDDG